MASFGFSIGKSAGKEYEEITNEVLSLHTVVQEVEDQALLPGSLVSQQTKLEILHLLLSGCQEPLKQIVDVVTKHSSLAKSKKKVRDRLTFGLEDLPDARSKLILHTSVINVFLTTLNTSSLERIERKVDELFKAVLAENRESTVLSFADENEDAADAEQQWGMFRMEMLTEGFSRDELDDSRSFVQVKIRDLMHNAPELPPAERHRKTPRGSEKDEDVVDSSRLRLSSPNALEAGVQLTNEQRKQIERKFENDGDFSSENDNNPRNLSPKIYPEELFSIFANLAIEKTKIDAEVDAYLKSKTKSFQDWLNLDQKLFHTMENMEDGFEALHQKVENMRVAFRKEAAQKFEAEVIA